MGSVRAALGDTASGDATAQPEDGQADEVRRAHRWADAAFAEPRLLPGPASASEPRDELVVLHKSHQVLKGRTVWNTPLVLGETVYEHGIYMDAPAAVRVDLSRPAVEFTATVGIDNNADTRRMPQAGSARFHVVVAGRRVFSTPVLRLESEPVRVRVPLEGARQFVIEVDDGGNGRGWDQCTWADAAVKLDDGSVRWLDQCPFRPWRRNRSTAPFSFTYGGRPSWELLPEWEYSAETSDAGEVHRTFACYHDPQTGLRLECRVTTYADAAGIDWVLYLSNTGEDDTPIIEQLMPLDTVTLFEAGLPEASVTLRWSQGDGCTAESFLPHDEVLRAGRARAFQTRSSDTSCFPFFNLKGPGLGWILAVGWTGAWRADFLHDADGRTAVRAGMQSTHFRLKPGERVRTPRILLLGYHGDEMIHGHNRFRRLMLHHYVPRRDQPSVGARRPVQPPVACNGTAGLYVRAQREKRPLGKLTEQSELALIPRIAGLGCEAYWMDAYWFPQPWSTNGGNWYPRPDDFPRGLRPLADAAHEHGMQFVLWFAPFFVRDGTKWAREHPEYVYGGGQGRGGVWKIADPEARRFLIDFLSERIERWDVDIYREDFGIGAPPEEGPDRVGIAEMRHVEGFYEIWSELIRRRPGLLIDNCCGGGRRIDLETGKLAFTLWRSDYNDIGQGLKGPENWPRMAQADQVMVTGLSLYVPFHTGPIWDVRPYCFRSAMTSGIVLYNDLDRDEWSDELARQAIAELKRLRPLFQGDLYPLLPLGTSQAEWYAYQLDRPDLGEGCALFFRRPECPGSTCAVRLHNIDAQATYRVSITGETYAEGEPREVPGRELCRPTVEIDSQPGSALLRYHRVSP
jgi:alpha-galactosidase